jgi:cytochrome oxidase assembly protein ShyY1
MSARSSTLLPWLITAVSVAVMCALGYWQLERMVQKQQRLASIAQKQGNGSMSLVAALSHEDPRDIRVEFNGVPNPKHLIYLDNQIHNQRVGFDIVVPVSTNAGWLLVNYGWVPAPDFMRTLPTIQLDNELLAFEGVVSVPGANPLVTETNDDLSQFPALVQQLDFAALSRGLGIQLLPVVIQLTSENPAFARNYQPVVMSPEKHLGYAVQWFGLAIAAAAIGGFAISKKGRSNE